MAKWTGEADTEQEGPGGGGGNKFPAAPRGFYTIQVADYKDGMTKETKRNKVDLTCEIADEGDEFGKKVWVTITNIPKGKPGHGIMLHTLHGFGIELEGGAFDFDTDVFQGLQANVLLGVEEYESTKKKKPDGTPYINERNFVEAIYTEKHPQPDELPAAPEAVEPTKAAPAAGGGVKVKGRGAAAASAAVKKVQGVFKTKGKVDLEEVPF